MVNGRINVEGLVLKKMFIIILFLLTQFAFQNNESIHPKIEKVDLKLEANEVGFTFIDLMTGEATLIQGGEGENILINSGGPGTEQQLFDILKMFNVTSLEALIITNADEQYIANTNVLRERIQVKKVITGQQLLLNSPLNQQLEVERWETWKANRTYEILPSLKAHVIYENYHEQKKHGMDLKISFHKHELLFMSSSDRQLESLFIKKPLTDINILKVPHFGQGTGSSKEFIDYINPQVAIIFRQHDEWPSQDVMERLYQSWMDIYPLKQFGSISIKFDENRYEVIPLVFENRK